MLCMIILILFLVILYSVPDPTLLQNKTINIKITMLLVKFMFKNTAASMKLHSSPVNLQTFKRKIQFFSVSNTVVSKFLALVQHFLSTVRQHKIQSIVNALVDAEGSYELADRLLRVCRYDCCA